MRIESLTFETFRIYDAERSPGRGMLDPITVFLRDVGGSGQITVECYGAAWSHWFGAIGNSPLREFVAGLDADYLGTKLAVTTLRRATKREEAYVTDIARECGAVDLPFSPTQTMGLLIKPDQLDAFAAAKKAAAVANPALAAEIDNFWFYDLRTKASTDVQAARGLQHAADLLGHASTATTLANYSPKGKTARPTK